MEFSTLPSLSEGLTAGCEEGETETRTNSNQAEPAIENELIAQELNCGKEIKLESQNIRGVSLTENFTAQQIEEHISSLHQCIDQVCALLLFIAFTFHFVLSWLSGWIFLLYYQLKNAV